MQEHNITKELSKQKIHAKILKEEGNYYELYKTINDNSTYNRFVNN